MFFLVLVLLLVLVLAVVGGVANIFVGFSNDARIL